MSTKPPEGKPALPNFYTSRWHIEIRGPFNLDVSVVSTDKVSSGEDQQYRQAVQQQLRDFVDEVATTAQVWNQEPDDTLKLKVKGLVESVVQRESKDKYTVTTNAVDFKVKIGIKAVAVEA